MALTFSPDIIRGAMNALFFQKVIQSAPNIVPVCCNIINTNQGYVEFPHLGDVPQLKEWAGPRKITSLGHAKLTVRVLPYEATVAFDRDHFDDDQMGAINMKLSQFAARAANHPVKLFIETLIAATTTPSYDGVAFFSNSHPIRGEQTAVTDNLLAGAGTTVANIVSDLDEAKVYFRRVRDEANEPFTHEVSKMLIIAPPELEQAMLEALFAPINAAGATNMYQGAADLWISGYLTDVNDWYVLNLSESQIKPFVFLNRQPLQVAISGLDRSEWTTNKQVNFGVDYRAGCAPTLFQLAAKIVN
ncbi:MAG: hypothetical protein HC877_20685 [Thioploca sp.]|nr:hypothetical protein [Thioploca sp.]